MEANLLLYLLISSSFTLTNSKSAQQILLQIKKDFGDPPTLSSWDSSTPHCNWTGIKCTSNSVTSISLHNQNILQPIPRSICKLKNLSALDLSTNYIPGPFPVSLYNCTNLLWLDISQNLFVGRIPSSINRLSERIYFLKLSANNFTGDVPSSFGQLSALRYLLLDNNLLDGTFPAELGNLTYLEWLWLANNSFTPQKIPEEFANLTSLSYLWMTAMNLYWEIPDSLAKLTNLVQLDLAMNSLSGRIPVGIWMLEKLEKIYLWHNKLTGEINTTIGAMNLVEIDVSMNNLIGPIPSGFGELKNLTSLFLYMNKLSGEIPTEIGLLPSLSDLRLYDNNLTGTLPPGLGKNSNLRNLDVDATLLSDLNLCSSNYFLKLRMCAQKTAKSSSISTRLLIVFIFLGTMFILAAVALGLFMLRKHKRSKKRDDTATWKIKSFILGVFNESNIVRGLTEENLIGSGGSGFVYKISLADDTGRTVAVKKIHNSHKLDSKFETEFEAEVEILGTIRHANIVKLLCCISSSHAKLLVYEYMENGSLDQRLHSRHLTDPPLTLDWPTRLAIAIGAAKGLCYMHHDCSPSVVHRDVKSSNILLDSEFNAKITDFGLARMLVNAGEPESLSAVVGSLGYMAPECGWLRKVSNKVDVFSFGVVLLELTTGREANYGDEDSCLSEWAWRHLHEGKSLVDAIDKEIRDPNYLDKIEEVLRLGIICTEALPASRPSMKEVLQILQRCIKSG